MAHGKTIPEAVHWIIIRLSITMKAEDIAMYTDVSLCTVQRILLYFKQNGGVNVPNASTRKPQLHRTLCDYDIQVYEVTYFIVLF